MLSCQRRLSWAVSLGCSGLFFFVAPLCGGETVQYHRDVRPILSTNCFHCHGPDRKHRKARLRLDTEKGVRRAFRGGDFEDSEGWLRVTASDPEEVMPPPDSHLELKEGDVEVLRSWIEEGAEWQGHWAFVPPERPAVPSVKNEERVSNPIDAFLLAPLEADGLGFSPEADRERLLRRVTLDLTGLPPTLAEIDAFLADDSALAWEHVVDRLLDSPHFGERMAVQWMDLARYGDSSVFHADGPRDMWPWRDWVLRAYNDNKPFDEFTLEQLAGDLLPEASVEQRIATGFNRNNATTDEGGVIPEEFRVEYAVDRVKTTSLVWMALSMECAQCHDHKYDPISQREYYEFFAYFNQASDPGMQTRGGNQAPVVDVPNYAELARVPELEERLSTLELQAAERSAAAEPEFLSWLEREEAGAASRPDAPADLLLHLELDEAEGREVRCSLAEKDVGKIRGKPKRVEVDGRRGVELDGGNRIELGQLGDFERDASFSFGAWVRPKGAASGAILARMHDGMRHRGWDLFTQGGKVAVHLIHAWNDNAVKVTTRGQLAADRWQHVFATYDGSSKATGLRVFIDGKLQGLDVEVDRLSASIRTDKPLTVGRRTPGSPFKGPVDDVRIYSRHLSDAEVAIVAGGDPITPILQIARADRSPEQSATLRSYWLRTHDEPYGKIAASISQLRLELDAARRPVSTVMVMKDVDEMRPTWVLDRGNYASPKKDDELLPRTPGVLPPLPEDAPQNRLGLARWLTSPEHPLTARVAVNRYWYLMFGTGLVKTVEDFGAQGEWPSHPALLDWLATEFVRSGWDVKGLLRLLVTSSAYRQTSRATKALREIDPENRRLARGPRFRLAGEFIRDSALAASGLLVRKIGGPSVKPYQPPGLWNEVSLSGNVRFVQDKGEKLWRRSLYTYWKRSSPAPSATIFDTPTREKCVVRRSRTNTPLQALVTLNDPQFVEAARALAQRGLLEVPQGIAPRVEHIHRLATGCRPTATTTRLLEAAYREELQVFRSEPERAAGLLAIGESPRDESIDAVEHAAWTVVASMILNLDQTLTRG